ncbi:ABC transporter substrate-binding protein [Yinghuangia sp. ASG 101]|uniref:peptide ABC transporter substrate-binding protein n=1 Tax=Yinghuangia sp. ASG 101 TaxID=2896848 RepID=UPI001E5CF37C|nr:ABC transporter substrate-binding protein [Yinghuangia sp. ASG 101]UGQ09454.1 ABC transporter substrate-binding protein [Yinghuangia sp. ASG 101]
MRGLTRVKWLAGAGILALAATACGGGGNGGGSGAPSGYYTASSTEPQNLLQPANANETGGFYPLSMLFRGLYTYDAKTGETKAAVAESMDSTDNVTWTVKLKSGWTFHNGEPVTAKSFVDAWNWGALSSSKQINATWFQPIVGYDQVHPENGEPTAQTMSGLKVVDDQTFTVQLAYPISSFKAQMGYSPFMPLPQEFYTNPDKYGQAPIGNGPFQLDTANGGWDRKKSITVKRYDNYAGEDKAKSEGVRLVFYTTYDAAYTALRDNRLDVIDQIPTAAVGNFQTDLGNRAIVQPQLAIQKIAFPLYDAAWGTPGAAKVRQGLSMAIDREGITKALYKGQEQPAVDWLAPGVPGHTDVCGDVCTYNPERAKQLIAEGGGIPGGKLTIATNADGPHKEWVTAVCNSINQALGGQACEPKLYAEFSVAREEITTKKMTGAYRTGWKADYPFPDNFLNDIYRTGAASNDSGYANPTFDSLAREAQGATDEDKALQLWQDAEKQLTQDLPSIPLWYYVTKAGHSTHVSNVTFDVFGNPEFTEVTVN